MMTTAYTLLDGYMMKYKFMQKIGLCLLTLCLINGCATPYQQDGRLGGYSDFKLANDIYKISFDGNQYTSADTVQAYLLRRAAELTQNNGYKYFVVAQGKMNVDKSFHQTPAMVNTSSNGSYQGDLYGNNYYGNNSQNTTTFINPSKIYESDQYTGTIIIKMLKNNKDYPNALEASVILENFATKK